MICDECMAYSRVRFERIVTKLLLKLHLLVLCLEVLKVFLEGMVMSIKLCNIDLLHCLHKFVVVFVYKINDRRKNITLFSFNCRIAMCRCFRRIKNINHMRLVVIAQ